MTVRIAVVLFLLFLVVFRGLAFWNILTKTGEKSLRINKDVPAAGTVDAMEGVPVTGSEEVMEKGPAFGRRCRVAHK